MLSAVISWESSYPAVLLFGTTGTPGIPPSQSSRTRDGSPQISTVVLDRDRAVLRRSEPSSRTALTGEQPDHWELLHPQDAMSRHRDLLLSALTIPSSFTPEIRNSKSEIRKSFELRYSCFEFPLLKGASLIMEAIDLSDVTSDRDFHPCSFETKHKSIRGRCHTVPPSLGIVLSDCSSRRSPPILTS